MKNIFPHRERIGRDPCDPTKGDIVLPLGSPFSVETIPFRRFPASRAPLLKFYISRPTLVCQSAPGGNGALNEYRWYWRVPGRGDNGLNFAAAGRRRSSRFPRVRAAASIDSAAAVTPVVVWRGRTPSCFLPPARSTPAFRAA